jgi:hypothetical protein
MGTATCRGRRYQQTGKHPKTKKYVTVGITQLQRKMNKTPTGNKKKKKKKKNI